MYREPPLKSKSGKDSFDWPVLRYMLRDIMKKALIKKSSKRARQLMCYHSLKLTDKINRACNNQDGILHRMIERIKLIPKSHRAAIDFDANFVMSAVFVSDFVWDNTVVLGKKVNNHKK